MFEESLSEALNIPTIGGSLVAECRFRTDARERVELEVPFWKSEEKKRLLAKYEDKSILENYEFRWKVRFWFDGPDRRYNGAGADMSEASLSKLIQDFETALSIIRRLCTTNFSGSYVKRIGSSMDPWLDIVGSSGVFGLRFSMSNDARSLWRTISENELRLAIDQLKLAQIRGPGLVETLRCVIQGTP